MRTTTAICLTILLGSLILFSTSASSNLLMKSAVADPLSPQDSKSTKLGNFSVSLPVKDIGKSKEFYEKLGFKAIGGGVERKYLIMQNDDSTIGLFQEAVQKITLTFNPGWDRQCKTLPEFQDVRELQKELKSQGIELALAADENSTGTAFFIVNDPDGNPILFDQHVPKPNK